MRTAEESRQRWETLFTHYQFSSLEELKQTLKSKNHSNPCEDGLRSVCWKAFLLHKSLDRAAWPAQLWDTRAAYSALREHFLKYIEHPDDLPSTADPLAEDDNSPWQSLRQNETIRAEILQDVERCLQENYFFREPTTKRRMLDILFIFVKLNPDLGYRQGMHELLAPVLWSIWQDAIQKDSLDGSNVPSKHDQLFMQTLDSDYIEHDAFSIFCAIMQTAKSFYEHDEMKSVSSRQDGSSIIARSEHIHQVILGSVDPELSSHLQTIEILPQIYLTRWLRLLFGREFPFQDMLSIWDLLFAEELRPGLIELVCVAMLLRIRWQLLSSDYSSALALLLKFPSPEPHKSESFVIDALFLEETMTLDGGAFLISKYSGRSPDFKMQSSQFAGGRTASQKRNAYSRDDDSRERNPPTRSPLRINHKRLDSLFQDVSEGIYRRAEGWGVTRAVRGAVIEARRNIQGVQSSPSTPGLLTKEALVSKLSAPAKLEVAEIRDLSLRILSLENRNKVLASMLGDALQELQAHNAKMEENSKGDSSENIRGALGKIEHVRTLLLNSSLPNTEKPENSSLEQSDTVTTKLPAEGNDETLVAETKQSKSPEPPSSAPLTKKDPGTNDLIKPMPIRPAPRASLAESPFSWMLGEDDRRSAFAPCASVPPEHLRKPEPRTRPALLFGDHRNDDKHKRVEEAENDVLVLDRLQGISKE